MPKYGVLYDPTTMEIGYGAAAAVGSCVVSADGLGDYTKIHDAVNDGYSDIFCRRAGGDITIDHFGEIVVPLGDALHIWGKGATVVCTEAGVPIARMFDFRDTRWHRLEGLIIKGDNKAMKGVDCRHTVNGPPSWVPRHIFSDLEVYGCQDCQIDLTRCEDSTLMNVSVDGRATKVDPVVIVGDYGIKFGDATDWYTGGQITTVDVYSGFCNIADVLVANISDLNMYGGALVSKKTYAPVTFQANIHVVGGIFAHPSIHLFSPWLEASGGYNILYDYKGDRLTIIGNRMIATNTVQNILANVTPCLQELTLVNVHFETNTVPNNVDITVQDVSALSVRGYMTAPIFNYIEDWIDLSKVTRYWIRRYGVNEFITNLHFRLANNRWLRGTDTGGSDVDLVGLDGTDVFYIGEPNLDTRIRGIINENLKMGNDREIQWRDSGGTLRDVLQLAADDGVRLFSPVGTLYIGPDYNHNILIALNNTGTIFLCSDTEPDTPDTYDLGSNPNEFRRLYLSRGIRFGTAQSVYLYVGASNRLTLANGDDFVPQTTGGAGDLGVNAQRWHHLHLSGRVYIDGDRIIRSRQPNIGSPAVLDDGSQDGTARQKIVEILGAMRTHGLIG